MSLSLFPIKLGVLSILIPSVVKNCQSLWPPGTVLKILVAAGSCWYVGDHCLWLQSVHGCCGSAPLCASSVQVVCYLVCRNTAVVMGCQPSHLDPSIVFSAWNDFACIDAPLDSIFVLDNAIFGGLLLLHEIAPLPCKIRIHRLTCDPSQPNSHLYTFWVILARSSSRESHVWEFH